ncbi:MAG: hypothetical protein ACOYVJ_07805 [Nitrospirota bacterium]
MARKPKTKKEDVDSYRHKEETRKNAVPISLASYDTSKPKLKRYDYDPHLNPQLLKRALKAFIDEDKFKLLTNIRSLPIKLGKEKRIAVKVIDNRGNEVVVVREIEKAISERQLG